MVSEKVAIVAGVGPGMGARFVEIFAQEGYRVVALARNADSLEQIRTGLGTRLTVVPSGQLILRIKRK